MSESAVPSSGRVIVQNGTDTLPVEGGLTVQQIRSIINPASPIAAGAKAYMGGNVLPEDFVVPGGSSIRFTVKAGEKG